MNAHAPVKTKAPVAADSAGKASMPFLLQRKCACGGSGGLAGQCKECEKEHGSLQRKTAGQQSESWSVPPILHQVLRSSGQPLNAETRAFLEPRFGHDFSKVRVHADRRAADAAESVDAHAFTVGRDVVFGSAQYQPNTRAGQRLLAHELAHVVQQSGGSVSGSTELQVSAPDDRFEREADRVADSLFANPVAGKESLRSPVRLSLKAQSIQRAAKFAPGTVSEELDLAERYASGNFHAGITNFILNGKAFTSSTSLADQLKALDKPKINNTTRADGLGVDCQFDSEPVNEATYDTKLLTSGDKWQTQTTKARMAVLFPALKVCAKAGGGDTIFTIKQNDAVAAANRAHEEHHANDDRDTFNEVFVPWDDAVTRSKSTGLKIPGTNDADCESKLYRASGTVRPTDFLLRVADSINAKAKGFHSGAGGTVSLFNVQAGTDCNAVTAEAK